MGRGRDYPPDLFRREHDEDFLDDRGPLGAIKVSGIIILILGLFISGGALVFEVWTNLAVSVKTGAVGPIGLVVILAIYGAITGVMVYFIVIMLRRLIRMRDKRQR